MLEKKGKRRRENSAARGENPSGRERRRATVLLHNHIPLASRYFIGRFNQNLDLASKFPPWLSSENSSPTENYYFVIIERIPVVHLSDSTDRTGDRCTGLVYRRGIRAAEEELRIK